MNSVIDKKWKKKDKNKQSNNTYKYDIYSNILKEVWYKNKRYNQFM